MHSSLPAVKHALRIVEFHFDEFTKRHFEKISKSLDINEDQLKDAIAEIRRLNPRPGGQVGSINKAEQYIVPDFLVYNNNGEPERRGDERNFAKYQERTAAMKEDLDRAEKNIEALKREIGNLK